MQRNPALGQALCPHPSDNGGDGFVPLRDLPKRARSMNLVPQVWMEVISTEHTMLPMEMRGQDQD